MKQSYKTMVLLILLLLFLFDISLDTYLCDNRSVNDNINYNLNNTNYNNDNSDDTITRYLARLNFRVRRKLYWYVSWENNETFNYYDEFKYY